MWKAETPSTAPQALAVPSRRLQGLRRLSGHLDLPRGVLPALPAARRAHAARPDPGRRGRRGARAEGDTARPDDRLAYCGYMNHPEVQAVVAAFADWPPDFPDLRVAADRRLAASRSGSGAARSRIRELGLADRVDLAGRVGREDLFTSPAGRAHRHAATRDGCVLASRPADQGGGVPGDRSTGGRHCRRRPAALPDRRSRRVPGAVGRSAVFGERLRDALLHPAQAAEIGRRGRETAQGTLRSGDSRRPHPGLRRRPAPIAPGRGSRDISSRAGGPIGSGR